MPTLATDPSRIFTLLLALAPALPACADHDAPSSVARPGDITTWAGDGTQGNDGDGHALLQSWFNQPMGLRFASDGAAVIADWNNHSVRRVTADGRLENVIGQPFPGDWPCQVPGDSAQCDVPLTSAVAGAELSLNHPTAVAWDGTDGSFYLAAWHNHKIEHYAASSGEVTIVAGAQRPGFMGDGGPASGALLNFPSSLAVQADGSLLVTDERNNRIRRIDTDADHTINTVAGAAPATATDADGVAATQVLLKLVPTDESVGSDNPPPGGAIALADDGALLIADTFHHCIRRVEPGSDGIVGAGDAGEETVSTLAGSCGKSGYDGDDGPATAALLNRPFGIELGPDQALYIADTKNHAVRRVDSTSGEIRTVAGTGQPGFSGDGAAANAARLREPYDVTFDAAGSLYIVDTLNNRIRQVAR